MGAKMKKIIVRVSKWVGLKMFEFAVWVESHGN